MTSKEGDRLLGPYRIRGFMKYQEQLGFIGDIIALELEALPVAKQLFDETALFSFYVGFPPLP